VYLAEAGESETWSDCVYIDGFMPSAAANLMRDLSFDRTFSGSVYAQPLYIEGAERADDCRNRIEQPLCAQHHDWHTDVAAN